MTPPRCLFCDEPEEVEEEACLAGDEEVQNHAGVPPEAAAADDGLKHVHRVQAARSGGGGVFPFAFLFVRVGKNACGHVDVQQTEETLEEPVVLIGEEPQEALLKGGGGG